MLTEFAISAGWRPWAKLQRYELLNFRNILRIIFFGNFLNFWKTSSFIHTKSGIFLLSKLFKEIEITKNWRPLDILCFKWCCINEKCNKRCSFLKTMLGLFPVEPKVVVHWKYFNSKPSNMFRVSIYKRILQVVSIST